MCDTFSYQLPTGGERSILNVFDFDNTLFRSPTPNPKLWESSLIGPLTAFQQVNNGWWHDLRSLQLGEEVEKQGWKDWWIEPIVDKVRQSMSEPHNFTVLLTGRVKDIFEQQILSMVTSKGLSFDLVILKPPINYESVRLTGEETHSTTSFKKSVIENIVEQNPSIKEVYMWEDRPAHVLKFQAAISELLASGRIENGAVIQVIEPPSHMPEAIEKSRVSEMVKEHNEFVDRWFKLYGDKRPPAKELVPRKMELITFVKYTGVFFSEDSTNLLLSQLSPPFGAEVDTSGWTTSANHVTMCLLRCSESMLDECGGLGASVFVKIVAVGQYRNRIWALKLHGQENIGHLVSTNPVPHITIAYDQTQGAKALESNLITDWQELPPSKQYVLRGVIMEKLITGVKKRPPPPPPPKAAVSLGALIKQHRPELKGPEIGNLVKYVQTRMVESNILNSIENSEEITSLIVNAP
ncbi:hypothetical protein K493DRAFT_291433 [Basidiobolus meristosporus CBS 931.73]|uniref:Swiss Army Knife RNA repair protein HAD domain-containing protein n=1 Tax=Basidiobolus meristosporus CBS 931.73 TaxID=1314790 RepID=A0A1Y1XJ14_9FUNG|nr:hypothetical protein K493DRAFT_291433 [Basidiobolus meristosporus CBS 931.73]|eukprot:ORX85751.1 hypothetical protein K493DRAFT_291433 [Basidiobolus meristosporus CBS 931.73]